MISLPSYSYLIVWRFCSFTATDCTLFSSPACPSYPCCPHPSSAGGRVSAGGPPAAPAAVSGLQDWTLQQSGGQGQAPGHHRQSGPCPRYSLTVKQFDSLNRLLGCNFCEKLSVSDSQSVCPKIRTLYTHFIPAVGQSILPSFSQSHSRWSCGWRVCTTAGSQSWRLRPPLLNCSPGGSLEGS